MPDSSQEKTVRFCSYCGTKLDLGAKFCKNCGESIGNSTTNKTSRETTHTENQNRENPTERKTVYEGYIHKCPNCGEILESFVISCPSCGFEIRGKSATNSLQQFYWDINKAANSEQKDYLIRNFPIPNTKEDILEFLILASSNILGEDDKDIFEAWTAKFEQGYNKAKIMFGNDSGFSKIQQIHDEYQTNVNNEKVKKINKVTADTIIRNIVVCIGIVFMIAAVIVDSSGGNSSLIEVISGIALIASAASIAKRGASIIDYGFGAFSGLVLLGLSFLLDNGSMCQLFGGIILVIIAVNYFKSFRQNTK